MAREVYVSSLSVGRCFRLPKPHNGAESSSSSPVVSARSVLAPEHVWKVCEGGEEVVADNAAGTRRSFAAKTMVVELPREGFERLLSR